MNIHVFLYDLFLTFLVALLGVCIFRPDIAHIVACLLLVALFVALLIARRHVPTE